MPLSLSLFISLSLSLTHTQTLYPTLPFPSSLSLSLFPFLCLPCAFPFSLNHRPFFLPLFYLFNCVDLSQLLHTGLFLSLSFFQFNSIHRSFKIVFPYRKSITGRL